MFDIWDTIHAFIHLPKMFLSTGFLFDQRIRNFRDQLINMD